MEDMIHQFNDKKKSLNSGQYSLFVPYRTSNRCIFSPDIFIPQHGLGTKSLQHHNQPFPDHVGIKVCQCIHITWMYKFAHLHLIVDAYTLFQMFEIMQIQENARVQQAGELCNIRFRLENHLGPVTNPNETLKFQF